MQPDLARPIWARLRSIGVLWLVPATHPLHNSRGFAQVAPHTQTSCGLGSKDVCLTMKGRLDLTTRRSSGAETKSRRVSSPLCHLSQLQLNTIPPPDTLLFLHPKFLAKPDGNFSSLPIWASAIFLPAQDICFPPLRQPRNQSPQGCLSFFCAWSIQRAAICPKPTPTTNRLAHHLSLL